MLDAMLQAAGHRVQRYVSPHLVSFAERILFDGRPIAEDELARVLDLCEGANGGAPITFFEITTAAAFMAFVARPADILLLETGLGGRLDATNVIARPRLTALAPIALDHQSFLGDTLPAIAFEKAGILKAGVPCIVGPQEPEALEVIRRRAGEVGAPLSIHGRDWTARREAGRLRVEAGGRVLDLPLPALPGRHQIDNAGLAVACALALDDLAPPQVAIAAGLEGVAWPARLQRLEGALARLLPAGSELWLDGGHNPAAGAALAASLGGDPRPLHLVVGMLATKDARGFLAPFARLARSLLAVPVPDEAASRDPAAVAAEARALGIDARPAPDVAGAIEAIAAGIEGPSRVLICGSLYLAGHVLRSDR
jgi:dihydrofolate synthase / folylpolyglutamate synthase